MFSLDLQLFALPFVVRGSCWLLPPLGNQTRGNKGKSCVSEGVGGGTGEGSEREGEEFANNYT